MQMLYLLFFNIFSFFLSNYGLVAGMTCKKVGLVIW